MKTMNYLNALLISLGMSLIANTGVAQELLSAKTHLRGDHGVTELLTKQWVQVNPNDKLRLVVKSNFAVVANIGTKLLKQSAPNEITQIGSGEVLSFESGMRKSKEFVLEPGFKYAIAFQGMALAAQLAVGQPQGQPFSISLRLENQDGRSILDFGDIAIQYKGKIQKPIQCHAQAYEIVEGIVNPSSTLINGTLFIQVENK